MYLTRSLILVSSLFYGCQSVYKDLQRVEGPTDCIQKFIPNFQRTWFTASVDVTGHHLSGLLIIKKMADGSERIVFTNELGLTFFDLEFSKNENRVLYAMEKLNKKPITNTLLQDFSLLIMQDFKSSAPIKFMGGNEALYRVITNGKSNYLVTDTDCNSLSRMEQGSARKKLLEITYEAKSDLKKIIIQHYNFNMRIVLTEIEK